MTASQQPTDFDRAVETLQAILSTPPFNDSNVVGPKGADGPPYEIYMATLTAVADGLVDPNPGHVWSSEDRRAGLAALGAFFSVMQAADTETGAYLKYRRPWLEALVNTLVELKVK